MNEYEDEAQYFRRKTTAKENECRVSQFRNPTYSMGGDTTFIS